MLFVMMFLVKFRKWFSLSVGQLTVHMYLLHDRKPQHAYYLFNIGSFSFLPVLYKSPLQIKTMYFY
jgi:hypothetical protein